MHDPIRSATPTSRTCTVFATRRCRGRGLIAAVAFAFICGPWNPLSTALLHPVSGPFTNGPACAAAEVAPRPIESGTAATASPPNILFILADDLGWNALSCYGNHDLETPHLDRLAATGMRFTSAYADAQCSPSRAAFLTGQYGGRTGMFKVIGEQEPPHAYMRPPAANSRLSPELACLPQCLRNAGYVTAISGKWHVADDYSVAPLRSRAAGRYFENYGFDFAGRALEQDAKDDKAVDAITAELQDFIRANHDRRWFAYAAHFTTHSALAAPRQLIDKHAARGYVRSTSPKCLARERPTADYLAMLEHLDDSVGRLLQTLDELRIADRTMVIFSSDNGGLGRMASMQPLRESKGSPYEGGVRVPVIVRWPAGVPAGRTCDVPVHIVDFFPTFIELAQARAPGDHPLDGQSLVPLLTGAGDFHRRALYWHMPTYTVAYGRTPCSVIRRGDWKLIHWFGDWLDTKDAIPQSKAVYGQLRVGPRTELYDLRTDIGESQDVAAEFPTVRDELLADLAAWWTAVGAPLPERNPAYSATDWAQAAE